VKTVAVAPFVGNGNTVAANCDTQNTNAAPPTRHDHDLYDLVAPDTHDVHNYVSVGLLHVAKLPPLFSPPFDVFVHGGHQRPGYGARDNGHRCPYGDDGPHVVIRDDCDDETTRLAASLTMLVT
jgi:hypothetical protein